MHRELWAADRFRFRVRGEASQRFLNRAAGQRIRLARLRREPDGFTATAFGMDRGTLRRIAEQGGWQWEVVERRGPGARLETLLARPGLPLGAALFFCLLQLLGGLVWTIDFGAMTGEEQAAMRDLLAGCGVREGVFLDTGTLARAQTLALDQSDRFGWISLNFTGGCLYIEETPAQYQTVRQEPPPAPLYAKVAGVITAVEAQSGFSAVEVGQQVAEGQLLVDSVRLDRSGAPVAQGASGRVLARVEKSYTATQPYTGQAVFPGGAGQVQQTWYLPGMSWTQGSLPREPGIRQEEWIPLRLGRLALPGCIHRVTCWSQQEQTLTRSADQARALAQRACRAQLYGEFPDAVIEAEERSLTDTSEGVQCTIRYRFCADIAVRGQAQ